MAGRTTVATIAVAVLGIVVIAVGAWALSKARAVPSVVEPAPAALVATDTVVLARVQMPALVGLDLQDAKTIVSAAGLAMSIRSENPADGGGIDRVVDQSPSAGELIEPTAMVALVVRNVADTSGDRGTQAAATPKKRRALVVCIDPGHQARSNSAPEPIGPGSDDVRPKVTGGATGVSTHIPEYELNLQIAMNLKRRLEARGVKVVMTRSTNDVNLANSERAAVANAARADLLVRIHCDGSPDTDTSGLSTLYPQSNRWTKRVAIESKRAARAVQRATVAATGAVDRGITPRGDLSGFNWSKVPAVLVECGFVSNPVEDRLLASPHYQDKVAGGIADGVLQYLNGRDL